MIDEELITKLLLVLFLFSFLSYTVLVNISATLHLDCSGSSNAISLNHNTFVLDLQLFSSLAVYNSGMDTEFIKAYH